MLVRFSRSICLFLSCALLDLVSVFKLSKFSHDLNFSLVLFFQALSSVGLLYRAMSDWPSSCKSYYMRMVCKVAAGCSAHQTAPRIIIWFHTLIRVCGWKFCDFTVVLPPGRDVIIFFFFFLTQFPLQVLTSFLPPNKAAVLHWLSDVCVFWVSLHDQG